jgi:hypothetical protein
MWKDMGLMRMRVLPMLRSWRILVPIKMADGFEAAILALEKRAMLLERIQLGPTVTNVGAGITLPGNVGLRTHHRSSSQSWCFDPP